MRTAPDHHDPAPGAADPDPDPLCQHEFDDSGLCAFDVQPGTGRCPGHQDDGQPDRRGLTTPAAPRTGPAAKEETLVPHAQRNRTCRAPRHRDARTPAAGKNASDPESAR
ncbi:hypothetical protein [Amycolatopsis sp. NPDC004079]|uniref:hypothetical protein n=1 Tax=Amycolatopsis sp. NPDC004079 TaxID=3154549 RepID=UPI0033B1D68E